jgi:hypothetical protein
LDERYNFPDVIDFSALDSRATAGPDQWFALFHWGEPVGNIFAVDVTLRAEAGTIERTFVLTSKATSARGPLKWLYLSCSDAVEAERRACAVRRWVAHLLQRREQLPITVESPSAETDDERAMAPAMYSVIAALIRGAHETLSTHLEWAQRASGVK